MCPRKPKRASKLFQHDALNRHLPQDDLGNGPELAIGHGPKFCGMVAESKDPPSRSKRGKGGAPCGLDVIMARLMALTSGTKLGPYEVQAPLGAGGMGEVYRALDTRLSRTVAVKVLASTLPSSPELKQRMEREARAIS